MIAGLADKDQAELNRIVSALVSAFAPDSIYLFGSTARGTPNQHSDIDLLVVVPDDTEQPHRLAQQAFRVIGPHRMPLDIVFFSRADFEWRTRVQTSLPSTVLREGRILHGDHARSAP